VCVCVCAYYRQNQNVIREVMSHQSAKTVTQSPSSKNTQRPQSTDCRSTHYRHWLWMNVNPTQVNTLWQNHCTCYKLYLPISNQNTDSNKHCWPINTGDTKNVGCSI